MLKWVISQVQEQFLWLYVGERWVGLHACVGVAACMGVAACVYGCDCRHVWV